MDMEGQFDFEGTEEKKENSQGSDKEPDKENDEEKVGILNLSHLLGKETLDWVRGDLEGKPQEIKQMGDDFAQKLNWYVASTILAQYSRLPTLFNTLEGVSKDLFAQVGTEKFKEDPENLVKVYNGLNREIGQVMEFARKFVVQNKDYLADNSNFFDRTLFEKIKSLPVDSLKAYLVLFQIIERKGHGILKEIIEKYQ